MSLIANGLLAQKWSRKPREVSMMKAERGVETDSKVDLESKYKYVYLPVVFTKNPSACRRSFIALCSLSNGAHANSLPAGCA
jgi:hypothetical protein